MNSTARNGVLTTKLGTMSGARSFLVMKRSLIWTVLMVTNITGMTYARNPSRYLAGFKVVVRLWFKPPFLSLEKPKLSSSLAGWTPRSTRRWWQRSWCRLDRFLEDQIGYTNRTMQVSTVQSPLWAGFKGTESELWSDHRVALTSTP
jgi:hypothetical protein